MLLVAVAVLLFVYKLRTVPAYKATWIWNAERIAKEKDDIISFTKQNGINLIYLHIDQKTVKREAYSSFIKEANAAGIQVDALAGDPLWSLAENQNSIKDYVSWVHDYNQSVKEEERFHGIHADIEFYALADWNDNKDKIIKQWMTNMELFVSESRKDRKLKVSGDVPFWIHDITIPGSSESLNDWIINRLDHVTLMSYRDKAEGTNSILEIIQPIFNDARAKGKKVVVGVNLLKSSEGVGTTFQEEGLDEMKRQLSILQDKLGTNSLFAGIAIHDYESWRELAQYDIPSSLSNQPAKAMPIFEANGIKEIVKVNGEHLDLYDGTSWKSTFWPGINLGATTPGHFPGELSPSRMDYLRWFSQMQEMNIKVIRIYTILPPVFYETLNRFNQSTDKPLYILQGIWAPDEAMAGDDQLGRDAYTPEITNEFTSEIQDAVRVIHGDANLPERTGHASGEYRTDVSQYVLGWTMGTEWYPDAVQVTNLEHKTMPPYDGEYISAKENASPFESWLASMLDVLAQEEMKYGWQHPVSFTNWLTTDPLSHPNEPLKREDMVSVDPMNLRATSAWTAGYFASYHVYPYYPDFMRYEDKYQSYHDRSGKINPYAGYLHDLRAHHKGMPIFVAEFGVPSSRGITHYGANGMNQGMHTESEQGQMDADMLRSIYDEGYDGAILFAWQDEWFKYTWNTLDLELPWERRAMWRNRLTNEENFGVIAVEAGNSDKDTIKLDGNTIDWEKRQPKVKQSYANFDLTVSHDEAYLYMMLRKREGDWDLAQDNIEIGLDTLKGGSQIADRAPGMTFSNGIEFLLSMRGANNTHLFVNSAYDQHTWLYGHIKNMLPWDTRYDQDTLGLFLPWKLALNKEQYLPVSKKTAHFEEYEVGAMKQGITDPESPAFNSLADWYASGKVMEIRIPWMLLGFTDPSSHQVWSYPYAAHGLVPTTSEGVRIEPFVESNGQPSNAPSESFFYQWEPWDLPAYHERKKQSYEILRKAYEGYYNIEPK
ncbi:hypothetical protein [Paenibacillus rigui]|uniref:Family 2 glycosyl transferase n=1 Tax=Paenibacillus rigui TaxID=554312 RepID=A0A229URP1_9BACL|nr:hypothetical protein [Paenibacillus rigui]OXM86277.1 hypothetical protein CF651_11100 [Paenibacillus rigui]